MKLAELQDYIRVPNLSTERTLMLGRALRSIPPFETNTIIEAASLELEETLADTQNLLSSRLRSRGPTLVMSEAHFDRAVDTLWIGLRKALEVKEAFGHPALALLPEQTQASLQLERLRVEAKQAAELRERLFSAHGTNFVLLPYVEQVGVMASILQLIADDRLGPVLEELVGSELPRLLSACQIHYEAMVSPHQHEDRQQLASLAEQRVNLRWAIFRYNNAILTLVDPYYPETLTAVAELLQPMINAHAQVVRAAPGVPRTGEANQSKTSSSAA